EIGGDVGLLAPLREPTDDAGPGRGREAVQLLERIDLRRLISIEQHRHQHSPFVGHAFLTLVIFHAVEFSRLGRWDGSRPSRAPPSMLLLDVHGSRKVRERSVSDEIALAGAIPSTACWGSSCAMDCGDSSPL